MYDNSVFNVDDPACKNILSSYVVFNDINKIRVRGFDAVWLVKQKPIHRMS